MTLRTATPERRTTRGLLSGLTGALVGGLVFAAMSAGSVASAPAAVAADDDSARPVTVAAADYDPDASKAPFPDLKITVSQTQGLVAQGIRISWTGGEPSTPPTQQSGGENFLQFAQCWGDDPENPGRPDRTTCQYGAFLTPGARRDGNRAAGSIAPEDAAYSKPERGFFDPAYTAIPFRSVTGETVEGVVDGEVTGVDVNTNSFFTQYTSNEIPWAGSGADGSGSTKFEVQTVVQSRGLGCGARVTREDGAVEGRSCWLVAIPRGTADRGENAITASGLFWDAWKHHIAVRLDFRPVGLNCPIGAAERQIAGSELIAGAVASWQPRLCAAEQGDIYTILTNTESDAVRAANAATEAAPLALTSLPYAGEDRDDLVYAPIGMTAVTVAFAIDRFPRQDGTVPDDALARARLPFESMNLTPRLIAKLLTSSYRDALPYQADRTHIAGNPRNLLFDPDFLEINDPEWAQQAIAGVGVADMLVPHGRSDVATVLWRYVMTDADARDFLAGKPDRWGMVVNKYASTDPEINPTGSGLTLPRDNFPKPDPAEVPAVPNGPAEINSVTWRPYTNDFASSAYLTLRGDAQVLSAWDPLSNPPRYSRVPRSLAGTQAVISLTDGAAAARYQVVTAALLNPAKNFVAPSSETITAAAAAMTRSENQPQVYGFDATSEAAARAGTAYPLAVPVYAAANPRMSDAELRASYATFIRYAATDGQTPGVGAGQLPAGYAPLPAGWRIQALAAAAAIEQGVLPSPPPAASGQGGANPMANGVPNPPPAAPASAAAAAAAPPADTPPADGNPAATGAVAGPLIGGETPDDPGLAGLPAVLPLSVLAGLASAAAVLLIPRLPRRG